jgi:hypothetical protein
VRIVEFSREEQPPQDFQENLMAAKKNPKHSNLPNLPLSQAMHGKNSSSAASPMDSRPKRLRSRNAQKKFATSYGW